MFSKKMFQFILTLGLGTALIAGCASGKMGDIPATADPRSEISKLEADINLAVTKNVDVLATRDFNKSTSYLSDAKKELKSGESQSEILDTLRAGKGALIEAYAKSGNRESKAEGLFAARQMALKAGVNSFVELQDDMKSLDSGLSSKSDNLEGTNASTLAEYQKEYVDLERRAVILSQLGKIRANINGAEKNDAKKLAPVTFKRAELSSKNAESIISTNVRNPNGYQAAVNQARLDSDQLTFVLATIEQNGRKISESAAVRMVQQRKDISSLEKNILDNTVRSEADQLALQNENDKLAMANSANQEELSNSNSKLLDQQTLEKARSQFSADEAEAYQQGDNLVIRLKKMNFASGKSDLPAASLPLLSKVLDVAKSMNSSQVKVEGHTDSIGSESENKTISESRATAVATYFKSNGLSDTKIESEGLGFKKPIATNKSKEGRAQNRRVDVIISPSGLVQ